MHLKSTSNLKYIQFSTLYSSSNSGCPNSINSASQVTSYSAVSITSIAPASTQVAITVDTNSI